MNLFISIIIPCYNEEKRLPDTIRQVLDFLTKNEFGSGEVILVNDGSSDKTLSLIKSKAAKETGIKYISYKKNRGKGYALKRGVLRALGKYILLMDADLSTPISQLNNFLPSIKKKYHIVIGTRKNPKSKLLKRQGFIREKLGKAYTVLANLLLSLNVSDVTCGFKIFQNRTAKQLFNKLTIDDWGFDAEILFLARKYKQNIKEIPVTWKNAPDTKVVLIKDMIKSFYDLLLVRFNDAKGIYD